MKCIRILIFFLVFSHVGVINAQEFKYRYKANGIILHKNMKIIDVKEPEDSCITGEIGSICETDGAIYIGTPIDGIRRYIYKNSFIANIGLHPYQDIPELLNNPAQDYNGKNNTNILINKYYLDYPNSGAVFCRNLGEEWYLPAISELDILYKNSNLNGGPIILSDIGITFGSSSGSDWWFMSSNEYNSSYMKMYIMRTGVVNHAIKNSDITVRCYRH